MGKRKFVAGQRVVGNDKKGSFQERAGTVVGFERRCEYWVNFDDGEKECVFSGWLDAEDRGRGKE